MTETPIQLRYDGDGVFSTFTMRFAQIANKHYVVGQDYRMAPLHERSKKSHDHYFAYIVEAWNNLPEKYGNEPWAQSSEHLRKYALIQCRYCDTQTYACGSRAEAMRWAANLQPIDEYSIITVHGTTVFRFTAESQSYKAMGKKRFQDSKRDVVEYIDSIIGASNGTVVRR